ncbi:MAG: LysM peptidoglycan-binding domain-containing protein [Atopobiaceae bacterium]|nr:LysM peptidoglycan-binding domain-containing protein [Atopobiaceae bacterium]
MAAIGYANGNFTYGNIALENKRESVFIVHEGGGEHAPRRSGRVPEDLFATRERPRVSFVQKLVAALVFVLFSATIVTFSFQLQDADAAGIDSAWNAVSLEEVVVLPGDTLWGIAEEHPVEGLTTEQLVHCIEEENGLSGAFLSVGERLLVPGGEA